MQVGVARVVESGLPLLYANQLGGQDELVFDGGSFGLNADRTLRLPDAAVRDGARLDRLGERRVGLALHIGADGEPSFGRGANWLACVLGLRDYVDKNGFKGVVLGLSGGVDSAICAAIAVDALGADRVHTIMLPYRYTAADSLADAEACARALGIRYDVVPIEAGGGRLHRNAGAAFRRHAGAT